MLEIDYHAHLIPGLDEGSRSLAESLLMARALVRLGVRRVHVTPHQFRFGNDLAADDVRARTQVVARHLEAAGLPLEVVAGAEHFFGERLLDALSRGEELLTWSHLSDAGAAECVLVEIALGAPVVGVRRAAALFQRRGLQPVMAHPERVRSLAGEPSRVLGWREAGWRFQLDLLSLVGSYGREAQRLAALYLSEGLYDFAGSDLHRSVQTGALARAHAEYQRLSAVTKDPA